jgi:dCTP deaminase
MSSARSSTQGVRSAQLRGVRGRRLHRAPELISRWPGVVEYFRIPRNVLTLTVGKSTYARCGIITNVTPFEPEWEGYVTLEISNTTPLPAKIYSNEGIAQVVFFTGDEPPEVSYGDKKGKYQGQHGVTLPRI